MRPLPEGEGPAPTPAPPRSRWAVLAFAPAIAYMGVIFYLSSLQNPLPSLTQHVWDKALHFIEYGTLGALLALAFRANGALPRRAILLGLIGSSLYAMTDEVHQAFVPGRDPDVHDWLADTLGAALGVGVAVLALRLYRARASIGATTPRRT